MAEEKKGYCHGINAAPTSRVWGHNKSPLFKLSAEVRNMIYEYNFAGSDIALSIDPPLNVAVVPVTGRRSVWKDQTMNMSTFFFLLTCAQVYTEALGLYWGQVIVRSGCDSFSRGFFLSRIPDIGKPYIQHLRNVNARPFQGRDKILRGRRINWPWDFATCLDYFPRLKTCAASVSSDESDSDAIRAAVASHPGVNIVEKRVFISDAAGWILPCPPPKLRRIGFCNQTLGKIVFWVQPDVPMQWYTDDSCINYVMVPSGPRILQLAWP